MTRYWYAFMALIMALAAVSTYLSLQMRDESRNKGIFITNWVDGKR